MKGINHALIWLIVLLKPGLALGQTWTQTAAPVTNWASVASSADGSKLVGVLSQGGIYTSTDYGATWVSNPAPSQQWRAVVSSADGTRLAAALFNVPPYTSSDGGASWHTNAPLGNGWQSLASSGDGLRLAATAQNGWVARSTNAGSNWFYLSNTPSTTEIVSIASSADGNKLVAMMAGAAFISTNAGTNWVTNKSAIMKPSWLSVASSADGNTLGAVWGGSSVIVTTNAGGTWTSNNIPGVDLSTIASSADGTTLVAAGAGLARVIALSTNSGLTWSTNQFAHAGNWTGLAASADGHSLVAAANPGGIWFWRSVPSPQMNITPAGGRLALAWTVPSINFLLQESPDLGTWSNSTNPAVLNLTNLQNEVFVSPMNNAFYRLQSQ